MADKETRCESVKTGNSEFTLRVAELNFTSFCSRLSHCEIRDVNLTPDVLSGQLISAITCDNAVTT